MPLPTIPTPQFTLKRSNYIKKQITMRPFLVGEETILLKVKDSEDPNEIMDAVKQVIKRCIVEPEDLNVNDLPTFVLELMFLRLRQNSNGELVELDYRCKNDIKVEGEEAPATCNKEFQVALDLRESDIYTPEGHVDTFEVGGGIGVKLKYPTISLAEKLDDSEDWTKTFAMSIESIYSGDEVWVAGDHTEEELLAFASGISSKTKNEIQDKFYGRLPTVRTLLKAKCPKCGHAHEVELNGLEDHFG